MNEITRQPVGGKSAHGGQRVGEMEKDVFCSNGNMGMLKNKMFDDSDGCISYFCARCGCSRPYNRDINVKEDISHVINSCSNCDSNLITALNTCHINNYVSSLMECSGITIDRKFEPIEMIVKKEKK